MRPPPTSSPPSCRSSRTGLFFTARRRRGFASFCNAVWRRRFETGFETLATRGSSCGRELPRIPGLRTRSFCPEKMRSLPPADWVRRLSWLRPCSWEPCWGLRAGAVLSHREPQQPERPVSSASPSARRRGGFRSAYRRSCQTAGPWFTGRNRRRPTTRSSLLGSLCAAWLTQNPEPCKAPRTPGVSTRRPLAHLRRSVPGRLSAKTVGQSTGGRQCAAARVDRSVRELVRRRDLGFRRRARRTDKVPAVADSNPRGRNSSRAASRAARRNRDRGLRGGYLSQRCPTGRASRPRRLGILG